MRTPLFTSDLHINHAKIIEYAKRPFPDVATMNAEIKRRWNHLVAPDDEVYLIGDVGMGDKQGVIDLIYQLNGVIYLIPGNHDVGLLKDPRFRDRFAWIRSLAEIVVHWDPADRKKHQRIILCHYAMKVWHKSHHGAWQLFGHSHGHLKDDPYSLQLDVGVDCWDFYPVSFQQLQEKMAQKIFRPIDHHGAQREQETNGRE